MYEDLGNATYCFEDIIHYYFAEGWKCWTNDIGSVWQIEESES